MANIFKQLREEKNLTQNEVCKIIGITQPHLSYLENGERKISLELALKLCDVYECNLNILKKFLS